MDPHIGLLKDWMSRREDEHLEFKEAKTSFEFDELVKYSVALANEGGGKLIFGVTDKFPRRVSGSQAFQNLQKVKNDLLDRLRLRVDAEEIPHPDGRVIVFSIPARPIGVPISYQGAFWMRAGESVVPMTPDQLRKIFDESGPDFSAEICGKADISDLDPKAIEELRQRWFKKSNNQNVLNISDKQLLIDAELIVKDGITYAALVLLGTREALGRFLAQAEVVFEYRSAENKIEFQQRKEYRYGFLLFYDDIWNTINLRNEVQQYQDGLFKWDVSTFNEIVVREGILNAVAHRNYRDPGSVFVKQYPRKLEIKSPGGFPPGITEQNILWEQFPRNRRIAEVFSKCGFVERSGQGVDWMVKNSIKDGKRQPDYSKSNDYHVTLMIDGEIQDARFLRFLEKVGKEKLASFSTQDFVVLDSIHQDKPIPRTLKERVPILLAQGIIEKIGHGRGSRYILSRAFYEFLGKKGTYTRKRGLDRETQKELLLKHIRENEGAKLQEFTQVLPELTMHKIQNLIRELKKEKRIKGVGRTKAARWYIAH